MPLMHHDTQRVITGLEGARGDVRVNDTHVTCGGNLIFSDKIVIDVDLNFRSLGHHRNSIGIRQPDAGSATRLLIGYVNRPNPRPRLPFKT